MKRIRNVKAFVAAYGKGPNGAKALHRNSADLHVAFFKRVDLTYTDVRPDDLIRGHNTMARALIDAVSA